VIKFTTLSAPQYKPIPNCLRAVTLVRVSTTEQAAEGRSGIDRQRQSNARVVETKNYQLVAAFEVVDVSGTASFQCPEFQQMVALIEAKLVEVVVVSEMSRILRPDDLSSFSSLDIFKRNGVLIDCGGTVHDLKSPEGFLAGGLMALLGGTERMFMLKRMKASKEASRANGYCPSAPHTLPLGLLYDRSNNKFHYGPEIWKVQEAFRLIDEEGIRNLSEVGRRVGVHHRSLKNLLSNKSYIGIREYSEIRDQNRKTFKAGGRQGDRPKIARAPEEVIRVRVIPPDEQAVSGERFERVQVFLAEIAERHARVIAPNKGTNLLSTIGFCGCCGARLYSATSSKRATDGHKTRGHYICRSHHYLFKNRLTPCSQGWLRRDRMDELVSAFVLRFLEDREFLTAILAHAKSKQRDTIVAMEMVPAAIRQQIADLERRDRRVMDAIEVGAISLSEAKQRRLRIEEQKRGLLVTLERAESEEENRDSMPQGLIGRIATMGVQAWTSLKTPREKKDLVTAMFMELFVKGESITAFRLAPSLVGNDSGDWGWVADIPITLESPFRITPLPVEVDILDGFRQCSRCRCVLPNSAFYKVRPACKDCEKKANQARYQAKVAAKKHQ